MAAGGAAAGGLAGVAGEVASAGLPSSCPQAGAGIPIPAQAMVKIRKNRQIPGRLVSREAIGVGLCIRFSIS